MQRYAVVVESESDRLQRPLQENVCRSPMGHSHQHRYPPAMPRRSQHPQHHIQPCQWSCHDIEQRRHYEVGPRKAAPVPTLAGPCRRHDHEQCHGIRQQHTLVAHHPEQQKRRDETQRITPRRQVVGLQPHQLPCEPLQQHIDDGQHQGPSPFQVIELHEELTQKVGQPARHHHPLREIIVGEEEHLVLLLVRQRMGISQPPKQENQHTKKCACRCFRISRNDCSHYRAKLTIFSHSGKNHGWKSEKNRPVLSERFFI